MRTSSAKAKGRRASQEVKDLLLAVLKDLQDGDIIVTPSGVTGPDLHLSPKASESFPFVIECKNQESIAIWSAIAQSQSHAKNTTLKPVLFFKRNRSEMFVALRAEDFLKAVLKCT